MPKIMERIGFLKVCIKAYWDQFQTRRYGIIQIYITMVIKPSIIGLSIRYDIFYEI